MPMPVLTLKNYGIANDDRTIIRSVTLDIPDKGIVNILGPTASGKSTLLRTLSGANHANPRIRTWGDVSYLGKPLGEAGYPALVMQSTKLMLSSVLDYIQSSLPDNDNLTIMQKRDSVCHLLEKARLGSLVDQLDKSVVDLPLDTMRHLAIARVCAANPQLVLIDDPTKDFESDHANYLLEYIKVESDKRAFIVASKHNSLARYFGSRMLRLIACHDQEDSPTHELSPTPRTLPSHDKTAVEHPPLPVGTTISENAIYAPEGFILLKKGEIAGYELDLASLQKSGVTHLISSTPDEKSVVPRALEQYGIALIHEPIDELDVPTIERASHLCEEIGHLLSQGYVVAIHCIPGFGSTGIVLALHLVWEGQSARQAIDTVRRLKPEWMRSEEHVLYLEEFANVTT